jgi:hypothetical protein
MRAMCERSPDDVSVIGGNLDKVADTRFSSTHAFGESQGKRRALRRGKRDVEPSL